MSGKVGIKRKSTKGVYGKTTASSGKRQNSILATA